MSLCCPLCMFISAASCSLAAVVGAVTAVGVAALALAAFRVGSMAMDCATHDFVVVALQGEDRQKKPSNSNPTRSKYLAGPLHLLHHMLDLPQLWSRCSRR